MTMTAPSAWDLLFEVPGGAATHPEGQARAPRPERAPDGWTGLDGPGVAWRHWPRSVHTGMPMMHVLTLRLPAEFQRQGPGYPGISFFAGEGQLAWEHPAVVGDSASTDPFLADLGEAQEHRGLRRRRDRRGDEFAILWVTAAELNSGPTPCRPDLRVPATHIDISDGVNCWDDFDEERRDLWLLPRADPNAGLVPRDVPDDHSLAAGYTSPVDDDGSWSSWAADLEGRTHLGGTSFPYQVVPDGATRWYLELDDVASGTLGPRSTHIDLESDVFDWQAD